MAEGSDQEKTEQPTEKRLHDTREKGNVPRSRELTTMVLMMSSAAVFLFMGDGLVNKMMTLMKDGFTIQRGEIYDPASMLLRLQDMMIDALLMLAPFFAVLIVISIAAPLALGGWSFSVSALAFKLDKLNPITGLGRVFGVKGLIELVKALLKFILVAIVAGMLLWNDIDAFLGLSDEPVVQGLAHLGSLLAHSFLVLAAVLILIAAIDVPYQLWDYTRQLRMSLEEIKEEYKQSEGSPETKGRIRRMQMEMSRRRMMEQVPHADVVVTNPTHFAVALKYDPANMRAPKVVASGADLVAQQIRSLASEHNVPLLEAPPLARALFYSAEIDQEIPSGLYIAVAQVLAYIYQLRTYYERGGVRPATLATESLPIPDDLRRD